MNENNGLERVRRINLIADEQREIIHYRNSLRKKRKKMLVRYPHVRIIMLSRANNEREQSYVSLKWIEIKPYYHQTSAQMFHNITFY